jgi:hypothetical protein
MGVEWRGVEWFERSRLRAWFERSRLRPLPLVLERGRVV